MSGLWQQLDPKYVKPYSNPMTIAFKKKAWNKRITEIYDKDLIDKEQKASLTMMIDSSDPENFTVAEECVKTLIRTRLAVGLNQGQSAAFEEIVDFIENPEHDAVVLKGYAGTGKTYLVKKILEYITYSTDQKKIAIGAPTNKAVSVLYRSSMQNGMDGYVFEDIFEMGSRITYSTIHKLLGLKEVITDEGEQMFVVDKINNSELSNYHYLIVDEVSMLDDKLCRDIMKFSKRVRIIFMGDPAQIPPVNRTDSLPFKTNTGFNFKLVELKEIMRQKGDHPIIAQSFKIRENLDKTQPLPVLKTELNDADHGIVFLDAKTDKPKIKELMKQYFMAPEYEKDTDYFKVIAWRNKTIDYINNIAREIKYGALHSQSRFIPGEALIVMKPIFMKRDDDDRYYKMLLTTSEELKVKKVTEEFTKFAEGPFSLSMKVYKLFVESFDPEYPDNPKSNVIFVVHEESAEDYKRLQEAAKQHAVTTKDGKAWVRYFNILKWSANVGYNYAITAHKSQGSTYKNVLILEEDIDQNRKTLERNRIKYTVYSRATDKLYVLRENYPGLMYGYHKS